MTRISDQALDRLVEVMKDERKRFTVESAWRERDFHPDEAERRIVKIVLSEADVLKKKGRLHHD